MKKVLLFLSVLAISSFSHGTEVTTQQGKITRLHFWQSHTGLLIKHENSVNIDPACSTGEQYILRKDHPYFKEIYSMLLAAHMSKSQIAFGLSGCHEGMPSIVHVYSYN